MVFWSVRTDRFMTRLVMLESYAGACSFINPATAYFEKKCSLGWAVTLFSANFFSSGLVMTFPFNI